MTDAHTIVGALGDSITAGTPFWDPNPRVREEIGAALDERHAWPYWAEQANPALSIRNHGVNTERTDQIALRLEDALAGASVLVVQGGINDIAQGRAADETIDDLRRMIRRGREAGARVLLTNVLPWNNGFPGTEPLIRALNARIARLALDEDVPLLDFYATLEDPDRPGRMREEWTSEGDHPSLRGYRRLGELAFRLDRDREPA
jgi:lysophospholipase L1-like esterase